MTDWIIIEKRVMDGVHMLVLGIVLLVIDVLILIFSPVKFYYGIAFYVLTAVIAIYTLVLGKKRKKAKRARKKLMDEIGASVMFKGNHVSGLPIEHGSSCNVFLCADKYRFIANADFYDLSFDKVSDVVIKSQTDVNYYIRFIDKTTMRYICFYYDNSGVHTCITVDCSHDLKAYKFVKDFKARNVNKQGKNYHACQSTRKHDPDSPIF